VGSDEERLTALEGQGRYRTLFERNVAGVFRCSFDGRILDCNEAFARIFGCDSRREAIGYLAQDFYFDSADREGFLARLQKERVLINHEFCYKRRDGSPAWVLENVSLVAADGAAPVVIEGTVIDITERKRTEHRMRMYGEIFSHTTEAISVLDPSGHFLEQNAAHRRLLGYPDEELLGQFPTAILGDEAFSRISEELGQRGIYRGEVACRTRSGTELTVDLSVVTVRNERGEAVCHVALKRDITEQKRVLAALRESEERFRSFMNNTPAVAFMRDEQGRYVYVNKAFELLVAKPSVEILGKTAFDLWPQEVARQLAENDSLVLSEGRAMDFSETTRSEEGAERDWLAVKFPFRDKQEKRFVGCVSIDVSERRQLEDQLRQAQKMETVGRLAGGIAHDFNNLLTVVRGYAELLVERLGSDQKLLEFAREIAKAGDRAASLTRQLLAYSRRQVLAPQVVDLNAVIVDMDSMLRRLIGEDIDLVIALGQDLGRIKADSAQLEQVVLNLCVNGRDAMPQGGRLTIETANVALGENFARSHRGAKPGPHVMLAVSDTGGGMDAETQKHIFEPFFTTKGEGKGTGLGLATVYGIVKQSGGYISVRSELGRGATFKVYMPRVEDTPSLPKRAETSRVKLEGSETIMLVEDEEAVRSLIQRVLESKGYKILVASSPEEAVQICDRHEGPIELLLTDVVMPTMSGHHLAEHLGFSRPQMKVLYMSGYTDDAILLRGVLESAAHFIQKPFTPDAIVWKVAEILSSLRETKS